MKVNFKEKFGKIKETSKKCTRKTSEFLGLRQTRFGANMLLAIVAVLGILILINFIFYKENTRWDLTKNKRYTLSQQTKKILKKIDQDVTIRGFYSKDAPELAEAKNLLKEYSTVNKKLKVEFIDPDEKPVIAKQYGVERYNTMILEMNGKKQEVTTVSESDITSGLLKLTKDKKKTVYFLTGHGEKDIEAGGERNYASIKSRLEKENYEVKTLSLVTKLEMPKDIAALVIASPKKKILDQEKSVIQKYLENDGRVFLLLDPKSEVKDDVGLTDLLNKWGITWGSNLVIDPVNYFLEDAGTVVVNKWTSHKITEGLPGVFFPGAGEMAVKKDLPKDVTVTSLAKTSGQSWLESDFANPKVKFDKNTDKKGPITIGSVAEKTKKSSDGKEEKAGTRLVALADSDFACDAFADILSNQDLFLNSVSWLTEEEELISIRPKDEEQRTVQLSSRQSKIIFYLTVVVMPLIVVVAGIWVWARRKRTN